jgi:hypothetical protein
MLLAIGVALLMPRRDSCPSDQVLTTTGWNEAATRCYTRPIAKFERGTLPDEQPQTGLQLVIIGAGVVVASMLLFAGRTSTRSGNEGVRVGG